MITAILDHLWQSTLFMIGAGLVALMLRKKGARVRSWVWFAASLKFLVPFAVLASLGTLVLPAPHLPAEVFNTVAPAAQPFEQLIINAHVDAVPISAGKNLDWPDIVLLIWALGTVAIALHWVDRWKDLRATLHRSTPLQLAGPPAVRSVPSSIEPGLYGLFRPVILMPSGITEHLSSEELRAVIAHESCHQRHRDNFLAAAHMLVEAFFWFHPLVWWLGARLNEECERACDEAVLASGHEPKVYAESILKVCKYYLQSPLPFVSGISGARLKDRIDRIIRNSAPLRLGRTEGVLLGTLLFGSMLLPTLAYVAVAPQSVQVETQAQPEVLSDQILAQRRAEQAAPRKVIGFDPKGFRKFVGSYEVNPLMVETVSQEGSRYFVQRTGDWRIEVFPESAAKFFAKAPQEQISFNSDADGRVTGLVVHQGGFELPAPRIAAEAAKRIQDTLADHIKNKIPSPGTDAAVRKEIRLMEEDGQHYSLLSPQLAALAKEENPIAQQMLTSLGGLKSITFEGVGKGGWDVYRIEGEHGQMEAQIMPLLQDGKIAGQRFLHVH